MSNEPGHSNTVAAVYELREAAVEHGKAILENRRDPSPAAHGRLIETKLELETKTVAALDECADSSQEAVETALSDART